MIKRLLLPLDENALSESVIPSALELASRCSAETHLVQVTPPFLREEPVLMSVTGREVERQQQEHSRRYLEKQAGRWADLPCSVHTPIGRTSEEICRLASDRHCDLIMMASHGRDMVPRWLLGSVAEGVLRQAPCPVLLLRPPSTETTLLNKILVPTDGSEASLAFLPDLERFLAPGGSISLLLSTGTSLTRPLGGMEEHFRQVESRLRRLESNGKPYPLAILNADPVHDILSWATSNGCDLIAMSTHGRSGFRRFWLGSVTEKVARHALCPVLVFPKATPNSVSD